MGKREKVIRGLECCITNGHCYYLGKCPYRDEPNGCKYVLNCDALELLKAQETSLERIAEDYGLTVDGVSFALDQYQTIINEITHGMMSKLSYRASDVLQVAQERWCNTCELKEAQEPVEPVFNANIEPEFSVWQCGACGGFILGNAYPNFQKDSRPRFCSWCGRTVKWE